MEDRFKEIDATRRLEGKVLVHVTSEPLGRSLPPQKCIRCGRVLDRDWLLSNDRELYLIGKERAIARGAYAYIYCTGEEVPF